MKDDAAIAAHNIYKGLVVGGTLTHANPTASTPVRGTSYIGNLQPPQRFQFDRLFTPVAFPFASNWSLFEDLAEFAINSSSLESPEKEEYGRPPNQYGVVVIDQGREAVTINTAQVVGAEMLKRGIPQGEDNGHHLVVFRGTGTVILVGTGNTHKQVAGRQFGPSVLAPFSTVIVDGSTGFVDGFIIAKTLSYSGTQARQVQLHGQCYRGPIHCDCVLSNETDVGTGGAGPAPSGPVSGAAPGGSVAAPTAAGDAAAPAASVRFAAPASSLLGNSKLDTMRAAALAKVREVDSITSASSASSSSDASNSESAASASAAPGETLSSGTDYWVPDFARSKHMVAEGESLWDATHARSDSEAAPAKRLLEGTIPGPVAGLGAIVIVLGALGYRRRLARASAKSEHTALSMFDDEDESLASEQI